jgi:hypothetical protein
MVFLTTRHRLCPLPPPVVLLSPWTTRCLRTFPFRPVRLDETRRPLLPLLQLRNPLLGPRKLPAQFCHLLLSRGQLPAQSRNLLAQSLHKLTQCRVLSHQTRVPLPQQLCFIF